MKAMVENKVCDLSSWAYLIKMKGFIWTDKWGTSRLPCMGRYIFIPVDGMLTIRLFCAHLSAVKLVKFLLTFSIAYVYIA